MEGSQKIKLIFKANQNEVEKEEVGEAAGHHPQDRPPAVPPLVCEPRPALVADVGVDQRPGERAEAQREDDEV